VAGGGEHFCVSSGHQSGLSQSEAAPHASPAFASFAHTPQPLSWLAHFPPAHCIRDAHGCPSARLPKAIAEHAEGAIVGGPDMQSAPWNAALHASSSAGVGPSGMSSIELQKWSLSKYATHPATSPKATPRK
jgi:hypothetical protein